MILETGQITTVNADWVWVKTIRQSSCGTCHARVGCGQNLLNRMVSGSADVRARPQLLSCGEDLQPGDEVEIAIEEGAVVVASLLAYCVPLLLMIILIAIGDWYTASDLTVALLGVVGLAAGVVTSRYILHSRFAPVYFEPIVLRRVQRAVPPHIQLPPF